PKTMTMMIAVNRGNTATNQEITAKNLKIIAARRSIDKVRVNTAVEDQLAIRDNEDKDAAREDMLHLIRRTGMNMAASKGKIGDTKMKDTIRKKVTNPNPNMKAVVAGLGIPVRTKASTVENTAAMVAGRETADRNSERVMSRAGSKVRD